MWFRKRATAIPMSDRSISASDAARILSGHTADRAKVRAMTRHLRELRGMPPHPALER